MWAIIATWAMAKEGMESAIKNSSSASDLVIETIKEVEDNPYFKSVGYGGLPNEDMVVELDAAYMDGNTLSVGAVAALKDIANPVLVAKDLAANKVNNFLVGDGAKKYAIEKGFEEKAMLSDKAEKEYHKRLKEIDLS